MIVVLTVAGLTGCHSGPSGWSWPKWGLASKKAADASLASTAPQYTAPPSPYGAPSYAPPAAPVAQYAAPGAVAPSYDPSAYSAQPNYGGGQATPASYTGAPTYPTTGYPAPEMYSGAPADASPPAMQSGYGPPASAQPQAGAYSTTYPAGAQAPGSSYGGFTSNTPSPPNYGQPAVEQAPAGPVDPSVAGSYTQPVQVAAAPAYGTGSPYEGATPTYSPYQPSAPPPGSAWDPPAASAPGAMEQSAPMSQYPAHAVPGAGTAPAPTGVAPRYRPGGTTDYVPQGQSPPAATVSGVQPVSYQAAPR
jgi:hypothetical protein